MNYLLISHDPYRKEKALKEIVSKIPEVERQAININTFHADTDPIENILTEAGTMPFGKGHRVVIVRNAQDLDERSLEAIAAYLKKPLATTTMVLDAGSMPSRSKIWDGIKQAVKILTLESLTGNTLDKWITDEAKALGKSITMDALILLRQLINENDQQTMKNELEKLALFTDGRPEIVKKDVEALTGKARDEDIFELTRRIDQKDAPGAMRVISALFEENVRPQEIIGLLAWQLRKNYLVNNTGGTPKKEAQKKIEILLNTDLAVKRSSLDPEVALEVTVMKLCAAKL